MINKTWDSIIRLGKVNIPIAFRFPDTKDFFHGYFADLSDITEDFTSEELDQEEKNQIKTSTYYSEGIYVDDELWNALSDVEKEEFPGPWTEFYQLTGLASRALLKHKACVFHGVAILWEGLVWLICAPSGTGKTTQLRHWIHLLGDEMQLISGDKPIIAEKADKEILVYSSPWNGKEGYKGAGRGKLGGLIYLEQAEHNEMLRIDPREIVFSLFNEFLFYSEYEDEIRSVGELEDTMLRNYPVWKLRNLGDLESAELTLKTLKEYRNDNR